MTERKGRYRTKRKPAIASEHSHQANVITWAQVYGVLSGANPLGAAWVREGASVVAWPQSGGWGFACLQFDCHSWQPALRYWGVSGGQYVNGPTFSGFAQWLEQNGWTRIVSPGALAGTQEIGAYLANMSHVIYGFTVLPVAPMMDEPGKTVQN